MHKIRIQPVGLSLSFLFAVSYILCVAFDLIFPDWSMYQLWQRLLPGFAWTAAGLLIGLVETVFYGYYIAIIFVPVYNYLNRQEMVVGDISKPHPMTHA